MLGIFCGIAMSRERIMMTNELVITYDEFDGDAAHSLALEKEITLRIDGYEPVKLRLGDTVTLPAVEPSGVTLKNNVFHGEGCDMTPCTCGAVRTT